MVDVDLLARLVWCAEDVDLLFAVDEIYLGDVGFLLVFVALCELCSVCGFDDLFS